MKEFIFALFILGGVIFMIATNLDVIPPRSMTVTRMWIAKRRILQYAQKENHLPANLSELSVIEGKDNSVIDGWRRPILYQIADDGKIVLKSYGSDGVSGGEGENQDLIGIFESKDSSGRWSEELSDWIQAPYGSNSTLRTN